MSRHGPLGTTTRLGSRNCFSVRPKLSRDNFSDSRHLDVSAGPVGAKTSLGNRHFRCKRQKLASPESGPADKYAHMRDRLLASAGFGRSYTLAMRLPNPSPVLDKNLAPMGPEFYPILGLRSGGPMEDGSWSISRLQFCTG